MGIVFERGDAPLGDLIADRALYLDKTETVIVEEGDPRSAFQFTGPGRVIEAADAKRLGLSLVDGRIVQGAPEPAPEAETPAPIPPEVAPEVPPEVPAFEAIPPADDSGTGG